MMPTNFTFALDPEQIQVAALWAKKFKPSTAAIGGDFTFSFTPTGLGVVAKVRHYQGEELDLTDYDNW